MYLCSHQWRGYSIKSQVTKLKLAPELRNREHKPHLLFQSLHQLLTRLVARPRNIYARSLSIFFILSSHMWKGHNIKRWVMKLKLQLEQANREYQPHLLLQPLYHVLTRLASCGASLPHTQASICRLQCYNLGLSSCTQLLCHVHQLQQWQRYL